jgi:hypothetical protein
MSVLAVIFGTSWRGALLVPIGSTVAVVFAWDLAVILVMRLFGIDSPFLRFSSNARQARKKQRAYVVLNGVVMFGWPMFVASLLAPYASHNFFGDDMVPWTARRVLLEFSIWTLAGLGCGYVTKQMTEFPDE